MGKTVATRAATAAGCGEYTISTSLTRNRAPASNAL